jgi:transposase
MLPDAVQVADPFHVVKLANTALDSPSTTDSPGCWPLATPCTPASSRSNVNVDIW